MRAAVAHSDKHVVLFKTYERFKNLFAVYAHFGFGVIVSCTVSYHDDGRIVVLNELDAVVVDKTDYGKGGISHSPCRTDGKSCGNG